MPKGGGGGGVVEKYEYFSQRHSELLLQFYATKELNLRQQ